MKNQNLPNLTDSATIMRKLAEHYASIYDHLEDNNEVRKHNITIFDDQLSRYTGETQEKVEYAVKCLPKMLTSIIGSISDVIAENNRDLLNLLNASSTHEHQLE